MEDSVGDLIVRYDLGFGVVLATIANLVVVGLVVVFGVVVVDVVVLGVVVVVAAIVVVVLIVGADVLFFDGGFGFVVLLTCLCSLRATVVCLPLW